ncbi:MAG: type II toxin-antitoxin system VapC family toxin [Aggregatilineales bacterium]
MIIRDALKGVSRLYVETAPFIYYLESYPVFLEKMRYVFTRLDAGDFDIFTCPVTLTETLVKPVKDIDDVLVEQYKDVFFRTEGIAVLPMSANAGEIAAELRAKYGLKTPDALHIASAIDSDCDAFLTNDKALKRVTEIRVLVLDDLELDDPEA